MDRLQMIKEKPKLLAAIQNKSNHHNLKMYAKLKIIF